MNRTPLTRLPAQNKTFEILGLVNQISRVPLVIKLDIRINLSAVRLQVGDNTSEVRQQ